MANPEMKTYDDGEKQLVVKSKKVERRPIKIHENKDKEVENADLELTYQTALLDLKEVFPEIPENLDNSSIRITKGQDSISISGVGSQISISFSSKIDNRHFLLTKLKNGNYDGLSRSEQGNDTVVFDETFDSDGFENKIQDFKNNSKLCNFKME